MVEEKYISKDYLHDYAHYYALCFTEYPKHCKRLHFFAADLTPQQVEQKILADDVDTDTWWQTNYLGFVVAKPIPQTVIGFSVLRDYNVLGDDPDRSFWGTRTYKAHVYGKEVALQSLAFQEQDSIVAACATTAVWSMLQKAAFDYDTILKTPSQITKDADLLSSDGSRLFPNKGGLTILQICQAIQKSGLVTEVKQGAHYIETKEGQAFFTHENARLKQIIDAYSTLGVPLILGIMVPTGNGNTFGGHAITIAGSKMSAAVLFPLSKETSWESVRLEKLYCHDDQFGPFVKVEFVPSTTAVPDSIKTPWTDNTGIPTFVTDVIVPLYPKIRISLEDIESLIVYFDYLLKEVFSGKLPYNISWEINLHFSENYKQAVLRHAHVTAASKLKLVKESLPKYIWVARCSVGPAHLCEIIFDATELSTAMLGIQVVDLTNNFSKSVADFISKNTAFIETLFEGQKQYERFVREKFS